MDAPDRNPAPASRPEPDEALVRRLLREQFPHWSHLPVRPARPQGWDNRTFRLGTDLAVRLPSAPGYDAQVEKEQRWLPVLAGHLPLPVPRPVAQGRPTPSFPAPWSVYAWLPGRPLSHVDETGIDLGALADDLGGFLTALRAAPARGGPPPGAHSCLRGASFDVYADEAMQALGVLGPPLRGLGEPIVARATRSSWSQAPTWVHGDVAPANLLVTDGRLSGVIDFGCSAVGDPACDLVAAWTVVDAATRPRFARAAGLDRDTWDRARGWAVWKAAITLVDPDGSPAMQALARRTFTALGAG